METTQSQLIQMQEEANRIVESIESQKLDANSATAFIYTLFIIVGISMIFENFVRSYREQKREKKNKEEPIKELRIKLLITYVIHLAFIIVLWLVCQNLIKLTSPYIWFLTAVTLYMVEIGPLFTIHFKKRTKAEKQ